MFKLLVEADTERLHKDELMKELGLVGKTEDALRGHKSKLNELVGEPLRVEVDADGKGVWKIVPSDDVS